MPKGCKECPRYCNIQRHLGQTGFCGAGPIPEVSMLDLHFWEEPCISGKRGSGAVFFTKCNLRCVFCQNHEISQGGKGKLIGAKTLATRFLELQDRGAHNINLVSPTHYSSQVAEAIKAAKKKGLSVPVVYNCNGYESQESLGHLDGLVDVYLPDLKYFSNDLSFRYSGVSDYFFHASNAIKEMSRQVGVPRLDSEGMVIKGLIVRHLVLPGCVEDSVKLLDWFAASLPKGTYLSLMSQYYPAHKAFSYPEIARKLRRLEYDTVADALCNLGIDNGYVQGLSSAQKHYTPDFS